MCNVDRKTVYRHLTKAGIDFKKPLAEGTINEKEYEIFPLPKKGEIKRYLFTCAQNNTHIHEEFWKNLNAYAKHIDAQIYVSTFTYNKARYGNKSVKRGSKKKSDKEVLWYDPRIEPFVSDKRAQITNGIVWCGEMNILPTQANPLSGLNVYTGRKSSIIPHVKIEMISVASGKHEPTKFLYTTGTITKRNYLAKKAGLKAEPDHMYGALLIEVDSSGDWFTRQIVACNDGTFQDLTTKVENQKIIENQNVEAITWGDIHSRSLNSVVKELCWGTNGVLDTLRPKMQFFHDIMLGGKTNHHERNNPHEQFRLHCNGWDSVTNEIEHGAEFLKYSKRDWCASIVVDSNHDRPWIERWLRETDYRQDPKNAVLFLKLQLAMYNAILNNDYNFHVFEYAMKNVCNSGQGIRFLREDEEFKICNGNIECGMHGHLGPNGSKGTPNSLKNIGRRANTAHTHSTGIFDGVYVAGTSTDLDIRFNRGPSSWSQSFIVTYSNGNRTIVTIWNGKWRCV